jgi:two-component system alkaline phosphatase synthesis response regulator PhoP
MATEIIMLVDDDRNLQWALKYRLEKEGYDVLLAADGLDALEKIKVRAPDLIILDLAMPRMNGFGLLEQMRCEVGGSAVPVIVLTAYSYESNRARCLELGAVQFLPKPFSPRQLVTEIGRILGANKPYQSIFTQNPPGFHAFFSQA